MRATLEEHGERVIGRYAIYDVIASGGMAVVHFGRLLGQAGFSRTVAIKRLHPQYAADPEFVAMFLDEAHLAVRVQHPNVVAPLDVVVADDELLVVMEYVSGETLAQLLRRSHEAPAPAIVGRILVDTLQGLHAAHRAVDEHGAPLCIVHRDISPQNVIVGADGLARVLDFGVAKAAMRSHATKEGEVKGKIAYMAPEQLKSLPIDCRADVFAAGVVLWEALTARRLFRGDDLAQTVHHVLHVPVPAPSSINPHVSADLDAVVLRALERDPSRRFDSAHDFARALEASTPLASGSQVADWVKAAGGDKLLQRMERLAQIESRSSTRLKVGGRLPLLTPSALDNSAAEQPTGVAASRADLIPTVRPSAGQPAATPLDSGGVSTDSARRASHLLRIGGLAVVAVALLATLVALFASPKPEAQLAAVDAGPKAAAPASEPLPAPHAPVSRGEAKLAPALEPESAPRAEPPTVSPRSIRKEAPRVAPAVKPRGTAAARATSSCDPPYSVDARGIRRIRPECM